MRGTKAKRIRRESADLARRLAEAHRTVAGELHHAWVTRRGGKERKGIAIWLGARRIYKMAKRATQAHSRPRPFAGEWFREGGSLTLSPRP